MSTDISIDDRVTDLADPSLGIGEFDALLYTWMIPHADDARRITANPRQLLMLVIPGFRWRTVEDVAKAIGRMVASGLLSYTPDSQFLQFPEKAFYHWQSYIPPDRRTVDAAPDPEPSNGHSDAAIPPQNTAKHRKAAETPQNASPGSGSLSGSLTKETPSESVDMPPDDVDRVYAHYKRRVQPRSRLCPRKKIEARLKTFTADELILGIDHFVDDWWCMKNNASRGADWFFESDKRSEHYLLMEPRQAEPESQDLASRRVVPFSPRGASSSHRPIRELTGPEFGYNVPADPAETPPKTEPEPAVAF